MFTQTQISQKYFEIVKDFKSYEGTKPPIIDYFLKMPLNHVQKIEIIHKLIFLRGDGLFEDTTFELLQADLKPHISQQLKALWEHWEVSLSHNIAA